MTSTANGDEPLPLVRDPGEVPAFPVDAFPEMVANKITELAEATQTDPAMAAVSALTALAACVGGRATIQVRDGWREPLCIFTATIARPGERKSAVQNSMLKALSEVESDLSFAGEVERLRWQDELEMAKQTVARLNKDAVNAAARAAKSDANEQDKQDSANAAQAAKDAKAAMRKIEVPVIPRLLADDVTPTAVATLLAEHGGRIAICSTEGGIFDMLAGRYGGGGLSTFLKAHSGDSIRVDRQSREPQHIANPALTMGLMVQPQVIETIAANGQFVGRGLLARFLYATPVTKVGHRRIGAPVSETTENHYQRLLRTLASGLADWSGDPALVMLDDEADAEVRRIEVDVESQLADGGQLAFSPLLVEWASKLVGATMRIAGLLHFAEHGVTGWRHPLGAGTVRSADRLAAYFKAVAINVFSALDVDPVTSDAVYLLERTASLGNVLVSERELFTRCNRSRFSTKPAMKPALDRLVEYGWLRPTDPPQKRQGGGRMPSPQYRVHPAALAADAAVSGASAASAASAASSGIDDRYSALG